MTIPDPNLLRPLDVVKAFEEAVRKLGKVNVLLAGRTGVGKSTLINSVFQSRMAETGQGEPVTENTRRFTKRGVPVALWDTRGLELADYSETLSELVKLVSDKARKSDPSKHLHVAWLCLDEGGRRVQEAEKELCRELARHMPVIGVITKSYSDRGFRAKVQDLLPATRNVVRVRSLAEVLDDGHELPAMGLEDLVELTDEVLPEGRRKAFAAAQKVSLSQKAGRARKVVAAHAAIAAGIGATPVPFADALALIPLQIAMLAEISAVFGLSASKGVLATLAGALGSAGAALGGRAIVTGILKLIPGPGTAAGGAIAASTAGVLTSMLGGIYIASLVAVFERSRGGPVAAEAVKQEFLQRLKDAKLQRTTLLSDARTQIAKLRRSGEMRQESD